METKKRRPVEKDSFLKELGYFAFLAILVISFAIAVEIYGSTGGL